MQLRPYQQESISALFRAWKLDRKSRPVVVAPTGSGKSLICAEIVRRASEKRPDFKILILSHRKEIIKQNAEEIVALTGKSCGIYSAGLGVKDFQKITCANIQSVFRKDIRVDLIIIDEAHLISGEEDSMYGKLLEKQKDAFICGLTATPMRLDQGSLIGKFFTEICYNISVLKLIEDGYLCNIISRPRLELEANMKAVRKSGNDYNLTEMAERFSPLILKHVAYLAKFKEQRKHWLVFATGIKHAEDVCIALGHFGISAEYVTGEMASLERDKKIGDFKDGRIQCLVNCDVLTTGFNFPGIDLVVLLRATQSTSLYIQIVGRGMRNCVGKNDCLVLDFGGNIKRHGPIDQIVITPKFGGKGVDVGIAPTKTCDLCGAIVGVRKSQCYCGYIFPQVVAIKQKPAEVDIIGKRKEREWHKVVSVIPKVHVKDGTKILRVMYKLDSNWNSGWHNEFLCLNHGFWAAGKARERWVLLGGLSPAPMNVDEAMTRSSELEVVRKICTIEEGKYTKIILVEYENPIASQV